MKPFFIILGLFLGINNACAQDIAFCEKSQPYNIVAQPVTELIPATNKRIGYCGITIFTTNNPGTIQLFRGSGVNCGINQTPMTENILLPTNQTYTNHLASVFLWTDAGEAICLGSTGNGSVIGSIYYTYR